MEEPFFIVEVSDSFPLDRSWRELARVGDRSPSLAEEEGLAKILMELSKEHAIYHDLISHTSLVQAGFCPPGADYPDEGQFMDVDPSLVVDPHAGRVGLLRCPIIP